MASCTLLFTSPVFSGRTRSLLLSVRKSPGKCFLIVAILLGLLQAWVGRFAITGDGISYLDMGLAYLRGDLHTAINGYWNPLYAWMQALGYAIFRPDAYWEYPVVQLVNFGIYAATACAFEYFLVALVRGRDDESAIRFIAYALFLWSSLQLIRVSMVNPDMLVAGSVYLALGILVRSPGKWSPFTLALALAAGYYAKAAMFPIAILILIASWAFLSHRRIPATLAAFAVMCSPLILALSIKTGHPTIGDTSRLNYAWYVNGVKQGVWEGGPPRAGSPVHPTRILLDSPRVYEFGGVFPVSNPIWYDESYWFDGVHIWVDPKAQARVLLANLREMGRTLTLQGSGFLIGALLFLLSGRAKLLRIDRPFLVVWGLSVASLVLLCVVHVETRYIGSFVTIAFLIPFTMFSGVQISRAVAVAAVGLILAPCFSSVTPLWGDQTYPFRATPQNDEWILANNMEHLGLQPGDKYATVCCSGSVSMEWAHLVHMYLVACFDWNGDFWSLSEPERERVLAALARSGAKVAVSEVPPPDPHRAVGWLQVGSTRYYMHRLVPPG